MSFPQTDRGTRLLDQNALFGAIISENELYSFAKQTATGTNQATALVTPSTVAIVEITSTPSGSGIQLPLSDPGDRYFVANNGGATLTVYTSVNETVASPKINGTAGTTGVTQTNGTNAMYVCMSPGQWYRISGT